MINKHIFDDQIQTVYDIAQKHNLAGSESDPESITAELSRFKQDIKKYAFRILMLGVFSSGKSAFLNKMLKESRLTEAQTPETTIATELLFDINPRIEAIGNDNSVTTLTPEQLSQLDYNQYSHLVYHLENKFLREHSDLIFVDMPGIDSNLENHNKAITRYIGMGSAYILLVSSKEGGLRQSLMDLLTEISYYPQSLACFVSMSEMLIPSELEQVRTQVESKLRNILYEDIPVQTISSRTDSDEDFERKLQTAIAQFEPQLIFNARYSEELARIVQLLKTTLETLRAGCTASFADLDAQILECNKIKRNLDLELDSKQSELKRQSRNTAQQICDDVQQQLILNLDRLARTVLSGEEIFKSTLMSIIRPVLIESSQLRMSENFQEFINSLTSFQFNYQPENDDSDSARSVAIDFISRLSELFQSKGKNGSVFSSNLYSAIAGIVAISTSVLNPVLELILVFLPQIARLLLGQSREELEHNQLEHIKSELRSKVIPDLCSRIKDQVSQMVISQSDIMLENLTTSFNQLINAQETAIKQAQQEKETRAENNQQKISELDADISRLSQILSNLQENM